jgi:large subunit ribosomal protein L30
MRIKLLRSFIGLTPVQRKTLQALGFKKVNQVLEVADNPCVKGMVNKVKHFVEVSK